METAAELARFVAAALPGPEGEPPGEERCSARRVRLALTAAPGTEGGWGLRYGVGLLPSGERLAYHEGAQSGLAGRSEGHGTTSAGCVFRGSGRAQW